MKYQIGICLLFSSNNWCKDLCYNVVIWTEGTYNVKYILKISNAWKWRDIYRVTFDALNIF